MALAKRKWEGYYVCDLLGSQQPRQSEKVGLKPAAAAPFPSSAVLQWLISAVPHGLVPRGGQARASIAEAPI